MPLFDTHTHIYLSKKKDQETIISDIQNDPDLHYITTIGTDLDTSKGNILLAKKYPFIIASVGIHPCYVELYKDNREETLGELEQLLQTEKVHAIGECGFDYYRLPPRLTETSLSREEIIALQRFFFLGQIRLAKKYSLPLILHNREARDDILDLLKEEDFKNFVFHCYSEDLEFAQKVLSFAPDAMISFSGIVTFKNAPLTQETARDIPLKNILIETDCPYLSPEPERGVENYPTKVRYVLAKIQSLRNEDPQEIEDTIYKNSLQFFGL